MDEGNLKLRLMGRGRARELFRREFIQHPELKQAYDRWVEDNQDQLRTMNSTWRAIREGKTIPSRQIH